MFLLLRLGLLAVAGALAYVAVRPNQSRTRPDGLSAIPVPERELREERDRTPNFKRNNPGNIRYVRGNNWRGQEGQQNGFVVFDTTFNGLRAMMRIVDKDVKAGKTISEIISEYAPPSENNTTSYIQFVTSKLGADSATTLQGKIQTIALVNQMIDYEQEGRGSGIAIATLQSAYDAAQ